MTGRHKLHDATGVLDTTDDGFILRACGTSVPSDAGAGYAIGCIFHHLDGGAGTAIYINEGTTSSCDFNAVEPPGSILASEIAITDSGGFTAQTTIEAALAELYQNLFSTQACIQLPLSMWRETSSNDIINAAGNGGILATDTTPAFETVNGDTDGQLRLLWAATNVDAIATQIVLPPDLDRTADMTLYVRGIMASTNDTPVIDIDTFFDEGDTKVSDATTAFGSTVANETATIAAADIPDTATTMSIELTPGAHGTDTLAVYAIWLQYKRKLLTS